MLYFQDLHLHRCQLTYSPGGKGGMPTREGVSCGTHPESSDGESITAHTAKQNNKLVPHTCCLCVQWYPPTETVQFSGRTWPCWNWQITVSPWHCSPSNPEHVFCFQEKWMEKIKENFKLLILAWETETRLLFSSMTFRKRKECCWVDWSKTLLKHNIMNLLPFWNRTLI